MGFSVVETYHTPWSSSSALSVESRFFTETRQNIDSDCLLLSSLFRFEFIFKLIYAENGTAEKRTFQLSLWHIKKIISAATAPFNLPLPMNKKIFADFADVSSKLSDNFQQLCPFNSFQLNFRLKTESSSSSRLTPRRFFCVKRKSFPSGNIFSEPSYHTTESIKIGT